MPLVVEVTNAKFFKTPLARVHHALSKNVPIQQCILLEAKVGEGLTLTGLDTRTHQLRLRVPDAEVFEDGVALVPGGLLWDLASTLDEVPLSITIDEQDSALRLAVGGRSLKVALFGEQPANFQALIEPMPTTVAKLDGEEFAEAIKRSLRLTVKSSFITVSSRDGDVLVYSMIRNRIFSKARLENRDECDPWSIGIQMDYLGKLPTLVGEAELHLDAEKGVFAVSMGEEHLLIRQTQPDAIMNDIDTLMAQTAEGYWIAKQDALQSDLKAAMAIKDRAGVAMMVKGNGLHVSCAAKGRGSIRTTHALVDTADSDDIRLNFDPQMVSKTFESLGAVDVLAEVLKTVMPGWGPEDPDEVFYNLRFMDSDKPEARKVVVTSLATGEEAAEAAAA